MLKLKPNPPKPPTRAGLRRLKVLRFIIKYKQENDGMSPAIREIMAHCDIPSTSLTANYINHLVRQGRLYYLGKGRKRNIGVVGGAWKLTGRNVMDLESPIEKERKQR